MPSDIGLQSEVEHGNGGRKEQACAYGKDKTPKRGKRRNEVLAANPNRELDHKN
jgi:hypothetical protein